MNGNSTEQSARAAAYWIGARAIRKTRDEFSRVDYVATRPRAVCGSVIEVRGIDSAVRREKLEGTVEVAKLRYVDRIVAPRRVFAFDLRDYFVWLVDLETLLRAERDASPILRVETNAPYRDLRDADRVLRVRLQYAATPISKLAGISVEIEV